MARKIGSMTMSNSLEPIVGAPLDGRLQVKTKSDLHADGSYPKFYNGMIVSVKDNGDAYKLSGTPTNEADWKKILTEDDLAGYQATITVDDAMSDTSENPVQNKVIKAALDAIPDIPDMSRYATKEELSGVATSGSYNDLSDKPDIPDISNYYTKEETDNIVATINGMELIPVSTLPTENIKTDAIYLVNDSLVDSNLFTEYFYVNDKWEKIGVAEIDLSGYYTKEEVYAKNEVYTKGEVDAAVSNIDLSSKVDKVAGKGLSTEDYTTEEKGKLDSLATIKSVGTGLRLDTDTGELVVTGASIAESVPWEGVTGKPDTFYDDTALANRTTANETAIATLTGTGDGSVSKTVSDAVNAVVNGAPATYDTLKEVADWINNDQTGAAAMAASIATKANAADVPQPATDEEITTILTEVFG